ncbi:DUF2845 domain-containing protein [Pseudomonas sp. GD03944]|uniref:DUF2845 domain-containing protein n=1 Tax=Pseudomonas sp. GD03944 TaxID=2975409 RepID=UPI002447149E|nr:DUF2845 domain-containing protein [Pseudomonas sp. GD03944]MDH1265607.1 DUF2845 domain-containing protein [Pseudomonas sp. GD03944]HWV09814.1 DUF2845 domain-containing protein [Pseudomonas sp.]
MPSVKAFSLLLLMLLAATAQASTLRCGSALISHGDDTQEVLAKCGTPISQDFLGYREVVDYYGFHTEVEVEEWSYGPRNGMYHFLRFEGNRLVRITSKRGR